MLFLSKYTKNNIINCIVAKDENASWVVFFLLMHEKYIFSANVNNNMKFTIFTSNLM